jgi:type IV fimbrial biogenesis protein FimT
MIPLRQCTLHGYALLELLVVLTITAIVATVGLPALNRTIEDAKTRADTRLLYMAFSSAHAHAIVHQRYTTICPLDEQSQCSNDWLRKILVFEDLNDNRQHDADERILQSVKAVEDPMVSRSYSRRAVTFSPIGDAWGFNGTLRYCFEHDYTFAASLIVYGSGRVRYGLDKDKNGIAEDSQGREISCTN